jgi:hypothetical protein
MKRYAVDIKTRQFSKNGEDICGDAVKVTRTPDSTIIVVSDGLGSGVKANVLATMTVELASGLFRGELSMLEILETLIATLPVCKWRNIAYSTFSIARIYDTGHVTVAEYDSPTLLHLRDGVRPEAIESTETTVLERTIRESYFRLKPNDSVMIFTDGIVHAGVGEGLPMGWQEDGILQYVSEAAPSLNGDCAKIADSVAQTALGFWHERPGDDGTVLCARYRKAENATVLTGPPGDRALVGKMLRDFLSRKGCRIACGGTTSHLLADTLGQELVYDERFLDSDLPPIAKLDGVDLVTEGILTLSRAAEYLSKGRPEGQMDAATELLDRLDRADGITFMVGTARNPAHQNTGLPESIFLRRTVVENLAKQLQARGKETELQYF